MTVLSSYEWDLIMPAQLAGLLFSVVGMLLGSLLPSTYRTHLHPKKPLILCTPHTCNTLGSMEAVGGSCHLPALNDTDSEENSAGTRIAPCVTLASRSNFHILQEGAGSESVFE